MKNCTSPLQHERSKDPAMTPALPMEHFTSNSGQMLKHHCSLPRTSRRRVCQLHGTWQMSGRTDSRIFYLSAWDMRDLPLGDTLSHYVYSLCFLTKQFQIPGSQNPKYPLQLISLHNRPGICLKRSQPGFVPGFVLTEDRVNWEKNLIWLLT